MEKPSLEIGNGNWAIKENSLLGHTTVDGMILPDPITVTRATLATRVNPSGLIEDVALLGSDIVINGDFAISGTPSTDTYSLGWYSNTANVSITNGTLILTNSALVSSSRAYITDGVSSTNALTTNKLYKLQYDVVANNGVSVLNYYVGGSGYDAPRTVGTHVIYFESGSNQIFQFRNRTTNSNIVFDNISIKEATIDGLARVDYTDGAASLLVEPARTNDFVYSEDFSQNNWFSSGVTLTSGQISPRGDKTAFKLQFSAVNDFIQHAVSGLDTTKDYTLSFYAKVDSGTTTIDAGNIIAGSYEVLTVTDQWQRFQVTQTPSATTRYPRPIQANGSDTIYLWGCQLEQGSYPTSYIKTSGTAVTRAQDKIAKTGISDKIGQTEGTFFLELSKLTLNTPNYLLISLNNAASNSDRNSVAIGFDNGNDDFYIRVRADNQSTFIQSNLAAIANAFYKVAIVYKSGASKIYINGNSVGVNSGSLSGAFTFAAVLDNLSFDYNGNNGLPFEGNVRQLQVYKTALTDLEMESLTSFTSFTEMANTLNYTIY